MEEVVTMFNMGESPAGGDMCHIGTVLQIYAKGRSMATVDDIELARPVCPKCGERTELIDGCIFFYVYKCTECGEEVKK